MSEPSRYPDSDGTPRWVQVVGIVVVVALLVVVMLLTGGGGGAGGHGA
jgi:preprotein translocase subunit SecG